MVVLIIDLLRKPMQLFRPAFVLFAERGKITMNTAESVIAIAILVALGVIGIILCVGKGSLLLGLVRDMENGTKKVLFTRICGILLLVIDVVLAVVVMGK